MIKSFHIFYFPFKWNIKNKKDMDFSQQVSLENIVPSSFSDWETNYDPDEEELHHLYDEKNYYYTFVHPVLYDNGKENTILKHFERKEPKSKDVFYSIQVLKNKKILEYNLRVDSINLNFYATGVGTLAFFLENNTYEDSQEILNINQYGRRIFPPFYDDIGKEYGRGEIALSMKLDGLNGGQSRYTEDFMRYTLKDTWQPARFIMNLIDDFSSSIKVTPVIDDRMFVNCWYSNKSLSDKYNLTKDEREILASRKCKIDIEEEKRLNIFMDDSFWYRFVFVDAGQDPSCRNYGMRRKLTENATYSRWQAQGALYGCSHYSLVLLTDEEFFSQKILSKHMRGVYSRMIELILVQRASMLRFSEEVTYVSKLSGKNSFIAKRISSLYKEYIKFVNQIHFREVTAQDQGIDLYKMLNEQFKSAEQIKDLDNEISELHNYVTLLIDDSRNDSAMFLSKMATLFLPATIVTGIFGMNPFGETSWLPSIFIQIGIASLFTILIYNLIKKK